MVRAVFFDFDNTLFSHRTLSIPQSARDAIRILQSKGIKCVLATGRHMLELEHFPEVFTLNLDGYVTIDGQLCLDGERNIICSNEIKGVALENLVSLFNRKETPTILVEVDRMYSNIHAQRDVEGLSYATTVDHPLGEYSGKPIYLGIAYITPEQEPWLHSILPNCNFLRWSSAGVDIVPAGRDKVAGIEGYLEHFGIPLNDYMVFGDGDNDVGMVKAAPIGVVLGNGRDSAKSVADYVTSDIDDNGVWNALVHYGLV